MAETFPRAAPICKLKGSLLVPCFLWAQIEHTMTGVGSVPYCTTENTDIEPSGIFSFSTVVFDCLYAVFLTVTFTN